MSIRTYVIDDEYFAVNILSDFITRTPGLALIGSSTDPLVALERLDPVHVELPDLIFVDVEMPQLSGLALAKLLPDSVKVVFTTSHRDFGPEAFELGAADYLLKPVTYERFLACIAKIRKEKVAAVPKSYEPLSFFVKSDIKGKLVRIITRQIIYISSELNYVNIHLSGEKIKAYLTMGELLEQLPPEQFCQAHRSYIVNLDRIRIVEPGMLRLDDQSVIDVGPKFKEQLLKRINAKFILSHRQ